MDFWLRRCVMRSHEEGLGGAIIQGCASAVNSLHRVLATSSVKPIWRALYSVPIASVTVEISLRVFANISGNNGTTLLRMRSAASCRAKAPNCIPQSLSSFRGVSSLRVLRDSLGFRLVVFPLCSELSRDLRLWGFSLGSEIIANNLSLRSSRLYAR